MGSRIQGSGCRSTSFVSRMASQCADQPGSPGTPETADTPANGYDSSQPSPYYMVLRADGSDITNRNAHCQASLLHYETQPEAEAAICGPSVVAYFVPRTALDRSDLQDHGGVENDPVDLVHAQYEEACGGSSSPRSSSLAWPRILA